MAGVYIHIPYCKKACHYCNFHFSTNLKTKSDLVRAINDQITIDTFVTDRHLETIYFGGGTPSLLSADELYLIMGSILKNFKVHNDAEITLEANPDDVTKENINLWKEIGINRISLGVQSFFDEDLVFMNRAHNSLQSFNAINLLQEADLKNISIDLIYGSPTTSKEIWVQNIQKAIRLGVPHISSYCLTIEPKTVLAYKVKKGEIIVEDHIANEQFDILINQLVREGFEHYEISNFARPGYHSKHNTSYWQNKHYHGFGPGAHAYNGTHRRWNLANNPLYIQAIKMHLPYFEEEPLTLFDQYNEYIMTRLRTSWGINLADINQRYL